MVRMLFLGLRSRGIGEGDEVIIASHTYIATAAAIREVGGTLCLQILIMTSCCVLKSAEEQITRKRKQLW